MMSDDIWDPEMVLIMGMQGVCRGCDAEVAALCTCHPGTDAKGQMLEDGILGLISPIYIGKVLVQCAISAMTIVTHIGHQPSGDSNAGISFIGAKNHHSQATVEDVAHILHCGVETTKKTLKQTMQQGIQHALHPLQQWYCIDHLDLNQW
jgi:hypothetical protein